MDGTAKILEHPEFEDVQKMKQLVKTLEEKAKLARIVEACLQTPEAGVRILIGRENAEKQMHHCALVVAPCITAIVRWARWAWWGPCAWNTSAP